VTLSAVAVDIRAIVFDAVGTLLHPEPAAPFVYAEVGKRFGSRLTAPEIVPRFAAAFREEESLDYRHNLETSEAREAERWRRIVRSVLDDVSDSEACFRALFQHFIRPEAWSLAPDTAAILEALSTRNFVLGMASNYDRRLRFVVESSESLRAISHLIISSEIGWRKPAAEFFRAVCRTLHYPPQQVLFVGDDRVNDYEGARSAGLPAVLFDPQGREKEMRTITSLKELL
jgi:putative hydrolase of the HAD superfamily